MPSFTHIRSPLRNRKDIARLVGLRPGARRKEIYSAFGKMTRCEAWIEIEEVPVMSYTRETWEIRILHELPRCRVLLRPKGRGEWLERAGDVPEDVLSFFSSKEDRNGRIVSTRSWRSWEKLRWVGGDGRRLKGKSGEIHAQVEIASVGRPTGETKSCLIIEALGAPYPDMLSPVRLSLPAMPQEINAALEFLKEKSLEQMNFAA